jgi:hypothetical protein
MDHDFVAYSLARHAAPHRRLVRSGELFYGVFAAPLAGGADLMAAYALVGHACYPGMEPLASPMPGFHWVWSAVLLIHLASLAVIASGAVVSYSMWRRTGADRNHAHLLMERGEGRTRFLAIVGMAFAVMFFLITAAETLSMGFVRLCVY